MALSFNEKQYWKSRVKKTVNSKITELRSLSAKVIEETKLNADCQLADELNISEDLAVYKSRGKEQTC